MTPVTNKPTGSASSGEFSFDAIRPKQQAAPAPCQSNCPCGTSIRDWIAPIAQRDQLNLSTHEAYAQAWTRIVENNPFPAVMGRICPHPCESQCNRTDRGDAISVSALERFLGDWALGEGLELPRKEGASAPQSLGVIGAGPAGLSYAYQAARRGHEVSIYDWHEAAGGMLRYGVPEYRLPREILDAEIQRIVQLGVQLHTGFRVGTDLPLDKIQERHDALFLGLGAQQGRRLHIPGESGPGVWTGSHFLQHFNDGKSLVIGNQMVVVGGGNTAIDVARAGRRLGAEVTIVYRRCREEMPAIEQEIEQAIDEGVAIRELLGPLEITHAASGEVSSIRVQRMSPGAPDESGRHAPVPIAGDTLELPVTAIVVAASQEADWQGLEQIGPSGSAVPGQGAGASHVSLGGDVLHQGIASAAIAQGRDAALLDCGEELSPDLTCEPTPQVKPERYEQAMRVGQPEVGVPERLRNPELEIASTISEAEFLAEAERCLSCGSCLGCFQCWMYCNAGSFTPLENPGPGAYFAFNLDICEGCGKCIELCPCGFLTPE
jgi:NADPH-dependent glutamate synthase beta subunit-like oxidoreductase/Pyruvate/2-oxoacid:ferredoxin oxidoreductase delta subunit